MKDVFPEKYYTETFARMMRDERPGFVSMKVNLEHVSQKRGEERGGLIARWREEKGPARAGGEGAE